MADLTHDQYELVLKYMETTNEDNFEAATLALQSHNFSLERAIQDKFNPPASHHRVRPQGSSDEQIIRKYIEYVTRRNAEWSLFGAIFGVTKTLVLTVLGLFSRVLPRNLRLRYFGSDFQKVYLGKLSSTFTSRSLPKLLQQTKNLSSKTVLLIISPKKAHPDINVFLARLDLQRIISRNFWLTGHLVEHPELEKIQHIESPLLLALRYNIYEEIVEVGRTKELQKLDPKLLESWAHQGRNLFKRDCNVLIKYRNFVSRAYGHFYEEEQEEQTNLVETHQATQEIAEQNQLYKRMEQEAKQQKLMEEQKEALEIEQRRRQEEMLAERQFRKASLPEEPKEGDIVRISFRCPDGSTILRNFHKEEKVDLIFQWVQLNDEIEFEDQSRNFEIMHSYPPQPLSSRREETLSVVFDAQQEKLVIREL